MPVKTDLQQEWRGQKSEKFNTWRQHTAGPQPKNDGFHPLYSVEQRQHFKEPRSEEFKWVSSSKPVPEVERRDRPEGKMYINKKFTETKEHFERRHMPDKAAQTQKTYDELPFYRKTFQEHNRPSTKEERIEKQMTAKARVNDLNGQRGGYPMTSLGDKNYKAVEYESGFFRGGGIIPGSTNKVWPKNSGGGKAVDFYSGLKLDGPLNPGSKNYEQVTREQNHAMEVGDVKDIRKWERAILAEVDGKYDPDDDSSDEEAIRAREERAAAKAAREAAEAEAKAAADPKAKKK